MTRQRNIKSLIALTLAAAATSAFADRPMVVDNALINARNSGDAELWVTNVESENLTTLAANYSFWDRVELGALLASGSGLNVTGFQGKWQITPSQANGCNFASTLSWTRARFSGEHADTTGLNGIMSCNSSSLGSLHLNLTLAKPSGFSSVTQWGIGYERSFGAITPHIEAFGSEDIDTAVRVGLRGDLTKAVQLDGSFGRTDGINIYTVGVRFKF